MSYLATLLVGVAVTVLVYGTVSAVFLWLSSVFVIPSKRLPLLPSVLALMAAWVASVPVAGFVIQNTFLSTLPWGHAAELFFLPYIFLAPVLFATALAVVRRRRVQDHREADQNAAGIE
jgi:hypothetical protein